MSNSMTPETDAMIETDAHRIEEYSAPLTAYRRMCELARTLERERDEALAFNMRASRDASIYASMLHEKLDAERALADRLARFAKNAMETSSSTRIRRKASEALAAWKEARSEHLP